MEIKLPMVNELGEKLLGLYDRYHNEDDPLLRESCCVMAYGILKGSQTLRKLFLGDDRARFEQQLSVTELFRLNNEVLFQVLSERFQQWADQNGFGPYDLEFRANGKLSGYLGVQRRIAVKASVLEEIAGNTINWRSSFQSGSVREVLLEGIGRSLLKQAVSVAGKDEKSLSYEIRTRKLRKYMDCAEIVFWIPVEMFIGKDKDKARLEPQLRLVKAISEAVTEKMAQYPFFC